MSKLKLVIITIKLASTPVSIHLLDVFLPSNYRINTKSVQANDLGSEHNHSLFASCFRTLSYMLFFLLDSEEEKIRHAFEELKLYYKKVAILSYTVNSWMMPPSARNKLKHELNESPGVDLTAVFLEVVQELDKIRCQSCGLYRPDGSGDLCSWTKPYRESIRLHGKVVTDRPPYYGDLEKLFGISCQDPSNDNFDSISCHRKKSI